MKSKNLQRFVLAAMFAAMTTVLTFFVKVPTATGYVHLGDAVIYLSACFLPTPYALISAGIGGALADLFGGYFHYILPTFIIKALISIPFTNKENKLICKRNLIGIIPAACITVAGYYLTQVIFLVIDKLTASGDFFGALLDPTVWISSLSNVPENTVQALASTIVFLIAAFAFDKAGLKNKLK